MLDTRLRAYVTPGVLLALGLTQHLLVSALHLSPWKGAGFGMFSTVDQPRLRFVRVRVTSEDGTELLVFADGAQGSKHVRDVAARARALPTDRNLDALARAIAGERLRDAGGGSLREARRIPTMVEMEVYRLRYLHASGVVSQQVINRYRWAGP